MRRKVRSAKAADAERLPGRRRDILPEVPVFQQDCKPAVELPVEAQDDPADDEVRRMVEAAYT